MTSWSKLRPVLAGCSTQLPICPSKGESFATSMREVADSIVGWAAKAAGAAMPCLQECASKRINKLSAGDIDNIAHEVSFIQTLSEFWGWWLDMHSAKFGIVRPTQGDIETPYIVVWANIVPNFMDMMRVARSSDRRRALTDVELTKLGMRAMEWFETAN